jgi:hypothetical protein
LQLTSYEQLRSKAENAAWLQADKFYEKLRTSFDAELAQRRADVAKARTSRRNAPNRWLPDDTPRLGELPEHMRERANSLLDIVNKPYQLPAPDPRFAMQPYEVFLTTSVSYRGY